VPATMQRKKTTRPTGPGFIYLILYALCQRELSASLNY
jgi:hypothetical protein